MPEEEDVFSRRRAFSDSQSQISHEVPSQRLTAPDMQTQVSSKPWRILCYGDSLTAGFYDNGKHFSPYGDALQEKLNSIGFQCDVSICGLSGYRTDEMIRELHSPVCQDHFGKLGKGLAHILDNEGQFDLVILMAGTNDFAPNVNLVSVQARVSELHETCHKRGIPTVMLSAPCNTPNLRIGLSRVLGAWAQSQSHVLAFIDPEDLIPRRNFNHWEQDQVHFTRAGSRNLGLQLAPLIAQVLQHLDQEFDDGTSRPAVKTAVHKVTRPPSRNLMSVLRTRPAYVSRGGA